MQIEPIEKAVLILCAVALLYLVAQVVRALLF